MQRCKILIYVLPYSSSTKTYHLSRLHRAPCSNISENSGKHFILQGRRVTEADKINKPLMLPAAKIASHYADTKGASFVKHFCLTFISCWYSKISKCREYVNSNIFRRGKNRYLFFCLRQTHSCMEIT